MSNEQWDDTRKRLQANVVAAVQELLDFTGAAGFALQLSEDESTRTTVEVVTRHKYGSIKMEGFCASFVNGASNE